MCGCYDPARAQGADSRSLRAAASLDASEPRLSADDRRRKDAASERANSGAPVTQDSCVSRHGSWTSDASA